MVSKKITFSTLVLQEIEENKCNTNKISPPGINLVGFICAAAVDFTYPADTFEVTTIGKLVDCTKRKSTAEQPETYTNWLEKNEMAKPKTSGKSLVFFNGHASRCMHNKKKGNGFMTAINATKARKIS